MSTIYKNLTKEDLKLEKEKPALLPTEIAGRPSLVGIKVSIFMVFFLSMVALAGVGYLYFVLGQERQERGDLEAQQVQFRERAQSLEMESDQYRAEIERLRDQLKTMTSERNTLKQDLDKNRGQIADLQNKIVQMQEKTAQMEKQAREAADPDAGFSAAFPAADDSARPAVSRAVSSQSSAVAARPASSRSESSAPQIGEELVPPVSKSAAVKNIAPAAPVEQAKETAAPAPTAKKQQVLTINRKFNFVVVNLGLRDQLKIGDQIIVERNGKGIGSIQVEKLYENFAACAIVEEIKNESIKEGDSIRKV